MRTKTLLATLAATLLFGVALATAPWALQPKQSKLSFVGTQAGAPFEGVFEKFTADIKFDPAALAASRFEVRIDTGSVQTRDAERDEILRGDELFAVKRWPQARYVAERFTARGGGKYSGTGSLTLRDVTREVPIEFTFEPGEQGAWLKGSATLKRLDFGVGQGEWRDTATVANEVKVRFALLLKQ